MSVCDFDRLFFTKLRKIYGFEKEYRVIKILHECNHKNGGYFITIDPKKYIRRIIVGWDNTPEEFKKIKEFVNKHSSIPVVQAIANGDNVEIR